MATITIPSGSVSVILNGHSITDFAEGDFLEVNWANRQAERINGEGGAVNINERVDQDVASVTIRVLRYSDDDITLNSFLNSNPIVVMDGSIKENYTKDGTDALESWELTAGTFITKPTKKVNNQTGDHINEYMIEFRRARRNV